MKVAMTKAVKDDVLTNGSATEPRKVTWKKPNGETGGYASSLG